MGEFARALLVFFASIDPLGNLIAFNAIAWISRWTGRASSSCSYVLRAVV